MYLLYGIVPWSRGPGTAVTSALSEIRGVGGAPVGVVGKGGLGAAVSAVAPGDLTPDASRVLAFAEVVEALHAGLGVLPVRYGCVFEDSGRLVAFLRTRAGEYRGLLAELAGCVEMGVRIMPPAGPGTRRGNCRFQRGPLRRGSPGRAYLAQQAARYADAASLADALGVAAARLRGALGALAERTVADLPGPMDRPVASLGFLVRREAVEGFRRAFRRIESIEPARLLLTGPWPPWSFAAADGHRAPAG